MAYTITQKSYKFSYGERCQMMTQTRNSDERGQGLVEYALILVLVAIVVIGVLRVLGPMVGEVFSEVAAALNLENPLAPDNSDVITDVQVARTGASNNNLAVTITVSTNTTVTIDDSQNAATIANQPCTGSCTYTLIGVGANSGTVTVTDADGGSVSRTYPAKP